MHATTRRPPSLLLAALLMAALLAAFGRPHGPGILLDAGGSCSLVADEQPAPAR